MRKLVPLATMFVLAACDQPLAPNGVANPESAVAFSGATSASLVNKRVGYYRITSGAGAASQAAAITAAGQTAVNLSNLTTADLAGIDVLFIDNPSNGSYSGGGGEFTGNLSAIETWVDAGGVLVFHDRYVTPAETVLPGGATFNIIRNFSDDANINVLDATTLVTNGPGGLIDDTSLDGGASSSHGFAVAGSLPGTGALILSRGDPDEIVTFSYCYGSGGVVYSSIPLDYYLDGAGPGPVSARFRNIYAPNVVAYGAQGFCDTTPPTIAVSVDPGSIWPPNHKMVDITATVTVSDNVSAEANITVELVSVASSEPDDAVGDGDGNTVDDVQGASAGTDDRAFRVRAERDGGGPGRTYTVTYRATDEAGNSAQASATIVVPHDKGKP